MGKAWGALVGALFFVWIADTRVLDPGEIGWLMRYDWPVHFFGWHFFRHEPWHWPPGLLTSSYAPLGTSIGFTDSAPLVAFALKPFSAWLPSTFQYIGPWLLTCFTLQGWFGAWLVSQWSPDEAARQRYCHDLGDQVKGGRMDDQTFYIVPRSEVDAIRARSQPGAVCGVIDTLSVCVTAQSYLLWRGVTRLD